MSLALDFLRKIMKEYHIECIKRIDSRIDIHDDMKMLLISKHLNWLKQTEEAYNFADTIDRVRELIRKN